MSGTSFLPKTQKTREINKLIYTDWVNRHFEKSGSNILIKDLPKDINDGVLLAHIVEFVCGKSVERIHKQPASAKQKLHNIERCLAVLEENSVVLNDVSVQGIFRAELKCVLALFYHLSRYKQKERDFKMVDTARTAQKRCLRPPSTVGVSRKSRSFNANDRNRINLDLSNSTAKCKTSPGSPVDTTAKAIAPSQSRSVAAANSTSSPGWRSKSMNVKHTASTKLLAPKAACSNLQPFKTEVSKTTSIREKTSHDNERSRIAPLNSSLRKPSPINRLGNSTPAQGANRKSSPATASRVVTEAKSRDSVVPRPNKTSRPSSLAKPHSVGSCYGSKPSSPCRSLERQSEKPGSCDQALSTPSSKNSEANSSKTGSKSGSMISRLRKLGSPTSTSCQSANSTKARPTSASKMSLNSVSKSSAFKKRAESCPPTSRLSTKPLTQQKGTAKVMSSNESTKGGSSEKSAKAQPIKKSTKSSFGKTLRSSKASDKKSPSSPQKSGFLSKTNKKQQTILKSDICPIIPMVTNANMPVQPISSVACDASEKPVVSDKAGLSRSSGDVVSSIDQTAFDDFSSSNRHLATPIGAISIASPREVPNKAYKTAMVAPFMRHESKPDEKHSISSRSESDPIKDEKPCTTQTEAREMAVKGIADLRQNLEETMNSLRNTQLHHQGDDMFPKRISAQLKGDISALNVTMDQEIALSRATTICRSHHNLINTRTIVQLHPNDSPKLNAGETLGPHANYKLRADRFSSLQRTRSARSSRSSWGEFPLDKEALSMKLMKFESDRKNYINNGKILSDLDREQVKSCIKRKGSADDASFSSGDLSDYIGDVSTDDLSSTNNSPQHRLKTPSQDPDELERMQFNSGLSKSTVDIDGSSKSLPFKKKGVTKSITGLRGPGSSVVGSRLACNAANNNDSSPCPSPSQRTVSNVRGLNSYKSLPRPGKSRLFEEKGRCKSSTPQDGHKSNVTFKRSPSLQKLLGLGKTKEVTMENNLENSNVVYSNPRVSSPSVKSSTTSNSPSTSFGHARLTISSSNDSSSSTIRKDFSHYNSLGRPNKTSRDHSTYSYLSLPRRPRSRPFVNTSTTAGQSTTVNTLMTWSPQKRSNANSAYSITPTPSNPFTDLLEAPSLNIDDKESINYFDPNSVLKNTDPEIFKREVSDWPLPTLHSSSNVAGSNTDMASTSGKSRQQAAHLQPFSEANKSMVAFSSSLSSLKPNETPSAEENFQSHLQSQAHSVSTLRENLSGIGSDFRNLSKEVHDNDTELQKPKNIEIRMKTSSPDSLSATRSNSALKKKPSCGSLTSIHSGVSASSLGSTEEGLKRKKKHWLRESLKTAFGKRKSRTNLNDLDENESTDGKQPKEEENSDVVAQLKEELIRKERKLTDIRLEALTSQHQLHQMQDAMQKMKSEIEVLQQENKRLNKLGFSSMSLNTDSKTGRDKPLSSFSLFERVNPDDSRIVVKVEFLSHMIDEDTDERTSHVIIGACYVSRSISWQELDKKVQLIFQNFCRNVSPDCCLKLDADSIFSYTVGDARRVMDGEVPDLLPCGYIIGNVDSLTVKLKDGNVSAADSLALELLIDRDTVQRYVNLILEHGRVMLSGPAGTGKSTLANRLAEHVVRMNPKHPDRDAIVRLDLKHRSEADIADYLFQLSEDCSKPESSGKNIPIVLVLDDLHRSSRIKEAILPLLTSAAHFQLPFLIGVAEHDSESGLELHQEFRWIMCFNHTPPVSQYLSRALRRSLCAWEVTSNETADEIVTSVVDWLPECWKYINKCIETFNSAEVTLGPRLFSACPMNSKQSLCWFTNLWNFSIVPYIISAVKQGCNKKRQNKLVWTDPLEWVKESWPWNCDCDLLPIRAEDVALDSYLPVVDPPTEPEENNDPLLNMMLKLQEAAAINCGSDASHEESFEHRLDKALGDLS